MQLQEPPSSPPGKSFAASNNRGQITIFRDTFRNRNKLFSFT